MADLLKKEMWIVKKYGIATKTLEKIKGYYGGYWGKEWFEKFKENPYLTMAMDGVGFKRADTYAQKLGFDMLSPIRVTACIVSTVEESSNGDTILELPKIIKTMVNELKVPQELIMNCILSCEGEYILLDSKYKTLSKYEVDNGSFPVYITTPLWYSTERYIFEWSKELEKKDREKVDWNIIEKVLEKNPTLNKEQKYAVEHFFDENFNMLIGSAGCLPYDTEVLTKSGWKMICECENEEIMVANPINKLGVYGKFEKPIFRKYEVDQFYNIKTGTNFDLTVSEEHKNLYMTRKGAYYKDISTKDLVDRLKDLDSKREINNKRNLHCCVIPETFEWFGKGMSYTDDYIRLKIAVICDGYFAHDVISKPYMCHVNLKKARKQERMEYLLNKLNITYTIQKSNEGYKKYYFEMDNDDKVLYKKWFFETNERQRKIIMEEILLWDGNIDKREKSIGSFSTTIKETADTIQLIACSLGYRTSISIDKRREKYKNGVCYDVIFSKNKLKGFHLESSETTKVEKVDRGKYMYCFTTSTGYFPIRQKNKIYITGNCGKSYLVKVLLDLLDSHGMTYTLLTPTGIASFNLTEKTGRESQTIHRRYATDNRITTDYVIIDEFGMCSCQHIDMLKYLVIDRTKTKPLFIGDKYQLPSISAGDFLSSIMNLLKCGKLKGNIFELTQIMRASNESYIPYLCNMFCGNNKFEAPVMNKRDLKGVEFYDREVELFSQIERIIKTKGWDWKETAVIMPQRKGENGCDAFNLYMQEKNKSEILYDDGYKVFKKNDMLMHIKNNTSLGIYNGELIEILDKYNCKTIDDEGIPVEKTFYRIKRLYDEKILDYDEDIVATQIMLSYANSVHKTQGATIKNVIFVGINDFSFMLSRNLTYVGLSRASENLVVICDKDAMVKASFKSLTDKRKTFLNLLCK